MLSIRKGGNYYVTTEGLEVFYLCFQWMCAGVVELRVGGLESDVERKSAFKEVHAETYHRNDCGLHSGLRATPPVGVYLCQWLCAAIQVSESRRSEWGGGKGAYVQQWLGHTDLLPAFLLFFPWHPQSGSRPSGAQAFRQP